MPEDTHDLDRLIILEHAQRLHAATMLRHSAMRHQYHMHRIHHLEAMIALHQLRERQDALEDHLAALQAKLDRGNGH